jgi:phage shock protein PspC (stress-responsive transcriptional regulator)
MNKTHTINISGIIFHIDEFAYEKLKSYLTTIRSYFKDSDGRDEIMTDIESRIAEIFSSKVNNAKQVILMEDVDEMIAIMGNPEVFKNEDASENNAQQKQTDTSNEKYTGRRRVFRDPDDKVLGGVCKGIANYFNFDVIWLRLAFVISFAFFGTGFLLYLILWIIIPKANTTAEKLEMRGEKVNISNIEKTLKEEMEDLKNRFNNEMKNNEPNYRSGIRGFISQTVDLLAQLLRGLGKVVVKFVAFLIVFIGVLLLFSLLSSIFGNGHLIQINDTGISSVAFEDILMKFFDSKEQLNQAKAAAFLLIGIPIIMLIYHGLKMLLKIKVSNRWLNGGAVALWLIGLFMAIALISDVQDEFKYKNVVREKYVLASPASGTLYLNLPDTFQWSDEEQESIEDEDLDRPVFRWGLHSDIEEPLEHYLPEIDIQKSKTDSFELHVIKSSKGKSKKEALRKAESISYSYVLKDSMAYFNPRYVIPANHKWRAQNVKIIVKVPNGKSVFLGRKIEPLIYDIDNVSNTYDRDMINHKWTMLPDGLTCVDCGDVEGLKKKDSKDNTEEEDTY